MRTLALTAMAAVAVAGCGISKDKYDAKSTEADKYLKQYQDEAARTAALEAKAKDLEGQLAAVREELGAAKKRQETTEQELAALEQKSSQYEKLTKSLQSQISAGQVEISELRGKMTVKLRDKILFPSGSATLAADGRGALDAVAEAFKGLAGKNVLVAGYTDDVPTGAKGRYKDNWELSGARAIAVVRYLQSKGVDPQMLGAAGFSEYRPVASNETPEGRSENRRIEIALSAADYVPPVVDVPK
ncbi:MAG TPA: OmpA family protein [Anaeromyxobacteraceae bacterium]|nr:OmpA family protein [Anaeromyxobacteraceae bacterium]